MEGELGLYHVVGAGKVAGYCLSVVLGLGEELDGVFAVFEPEGDVVAVHGLSVVGRFL